MLEFLFGQEKILNKISELETTQILEPVKEASLIETGTGTSLLMILIVASILLSSIFFLRLKNKVNKIS